MSNEKKRILSILFFLFVLSLSTACSRSTSSSSASGQTPAPDFVLPKLGGGNLSLSSLKGKVIILDFWASNCPPCRMEIPFFIELYKLYRGKGLQIVGVCLESESKAKAFARSQGINYPLVLGSAKIIQDYGGIRFIPTTFIINRQGNIVSKHVGFAQRKVFEAEIKDLL